MTLREELAPIGHPEWWARIDANAGRSNPTPPFETTKMLWGEMELRGRKRWLQRRTSLTLEPRGGAFKPMSRFLPPKTQEEVRKT